MIWVNHPCKMRDNFMSRAQSLSFQQYSAESAFIFLFSLRVSGAALLKKRWITLSPTSASLSWIRRPTVASVSGLETPAVCHLHVCQVLQRLEHPPLYVFYFNSFDAPGEHKHVSFVSKHIILYIYIFSSHIMKKNHFIYRF